MDRGEPSKGMTAARAAKLDALGFAWELSAAAISKRQSEGGRPGQHPMGGAAGQGQGL